LRRRASILVLVAAFALAGAHAADGAGVLRERAAALAPRLADNEFRAPLVVESEAAGDRSRGDVYARIAQPFATLAAELAQPGPWCEVLILHLNVKRCGARGNTLVVHLGRKFEQPLEDAYRLEIADFSVQSSEGWLQVRMSAPKGPMSTRDYLIEFEAVPTPEGMSFVHLRYGLAAGLMGRIAMDLYLSTMGSAKTGFSAARPGDPPSAPRIGGARGAVERNAMRYHLAIVAYLDSLAAPAADRSARRLAAWFDATERYAAQLHEIERHEYLTMKQHELARQAAPLP